MPPPSRIIVVGCSGSGKSTLAAALARRYGLPFAPTDDMYWQPDWTPTPEPEVRAWLEAQTARPAWVLDGNFDAQREVLCGRAELAVWLDLPWTTTVGRVLWRNLRWWALGTPIWGGQRMTWAKVIGGVRHASRSYAPKRAAYPALLAGFPQLQVVRLRSPREVRAWLASLPAA
jgi:hypothetical protein